MESTGVKIDPKYLPSEMKMEMYPKFPQNATFDRIEFTLELEPGFVELKF